MSSPLLIGLRYTQDRPLELLHTTTRNFRLSLYLTATPAAQATQRQVVMLLHVIVEEEEYVTITWVWVRIAGSRQ